MLFVSEPGLGESEKAALAQVIDSGWITMGNRVRAFEQAFAQAHGLADAVAVSSCTTGLHLVMEALGIGPGDEVLVPSLSFVATANSVLYAGATPVFVDIESLDVPLVSYADASAKCTPRTKAVIVMHYAGYRVDSAAWQEFARVRGLHVIEDAAHAAGLDHAGMFSDAAVFSFFGNKNMTTAEGGMVVARDEDVLARVRQMRSHGMTNGTLQRLSDRAVTYDVTMLGYNYRMDELRAALGLVQLKNLECWNDKRRALTDTYRRLLGSHCPAVSVPFSQPRASSCHILPVLLPESSDRHRVVGRLWDAEIQTSVHYPPIHRFSWYRARFPSLSLPRTEEFCRRELTLPLHPKMTHLDAERVSRVLAEALKSEAPPMRRRSSDVGPDAVATPAQKSSVALRVLDVLVAATGLIVFLPLMILVAAALFIESGRPIFYAQTRLGICGRHFRMYKFKKFGNAAASRGHALTLENDARMTRVGAVLARTKLDELPQLWNVLEGTMSIVGPRPESLVFQDCFQGPFSAVLNHKPGIFGPSQVLFRDEAVFYRGQRDPEHFYREVLFPLKASIDIAYFANRNLLQDVGWLVRGTLAVCGWSTLSLEETRLAERAEHWIRGSSPEGINPTLARLFARLGRRGAAWTPRAPAIESFSDNFSALHPTLVDGGRHVTGKAHGPETGACI